MSSELSPTIIPSFVVACKEETVVIEFKNSFSSSQELITLDFFEDVTKKGDSAQCIQLGPNTIKVTFPAFSKPGMIEVVPKIAQKCNPLFPTFSVYVASPVEAIYNRLPCSRVQDNKAILSCILTYLTHICSEDAQNARLQADTIICTLLKSMSEIPSWGLASFLCGDERNDNLLHFATRYKLDGMAETLAHHIPKNKDVLWQVSSEKETATEIAKKNGMVQVMNTLERLQASYGTQKDENLSEYDNETCRISPISTSSAPESTYSRKRAVNEACNLEVLNDISRQHLYKAKVIKDYQWSLYPCGELSLKVGDIVYITQEKEDEMCIGIANLSYGQLPKHVLQQVTTTQETAEGNSITNVPSSSKPVPKPRKTSAPSSELKNNSEVEPSTLLTEGNIVAISEHLECVPFATDSHTILESPKTILSDSNTISSTLPIIEAPPPISPRIKDNTSPIPQTENTSPASEMSQMPSTPPVSPRLKSHSTPLASPRPNTLQVGDNYGQKIDNTSPASPTFLAVDASPVGPNSQMTSTPPVSPRLKRLQADNSPRIRTDSAPTASPRPHRRQIGEEDSGQKMGNMEDATSKSQMPVSPRIKRLQAESSPRMRTDSAPTASPRPHRLQMDDTSPASLILQTDSTRPVSPRLQRLNVENKPPISPKPKLDCTTAPASPG